MVYVTLILIIHFKFETTICMQVFMAVLCVLQNLLSYNCPCGYVNTQSNTVQPVLSGHIWDKEKVIS